MAKTIVDLIEKALEEGDGWVGGYSCRSYGTGPARAALLGALWDQPVFYKNKVYYRQDNNDYPASIEVLENVQPADEVEVK